MREHPDFEWSEVEGGGLAEDLILRIRPVSERHRVATVTAHEGGNRFSVEFAGHEISAFAYDDDGERLEVLRDCLAEAIALARGPTRVVLEFAGEVLVRSTAARLDGSGVEVRPQRVEYPIRRLVSRLRRQVRRHEVVDFPSLGHSDHEDGP